MSAKLVIVQQYLSWKGHYKKYFENLQDPKYGYLYASNNQQSYVNAKWIISDFNSENLLTIKSKIKGRFLDSYKVFKYLSTSAFDVIHLIEFEPLTYLLFANRFKKNTNFIITIHSSDKLHFSSWINNKISGLQRWLLNRALKKAMISDSYIVTHYKCHKESIVKIIGESFREKVIVINYPAPEPDTFETKKAKDLKTPHYLIYGQIREDKGIYEFLNNESTKKLNITIAGKIVDQRIFEFSGRSNLVIIDKFLSENEISHLVETHDFMLLPYPLEYTNGAGTFKDSLAKAMPVICSRIEIFEEIVNEHQVGLIFKHPDEITGLVAKLSENDYKLLSQNCLKYANLYNWAYMQRSYFSLYERLLARKSFK